MGNPSSKKCDKEYMEQDHDVIENQADGDVTDGVSCTKDIEEEVRKLDCKAWKYIKKLFGNTSFYIYYLTTLQLTSGDISQTQFQSLYFIQLLT